MQTVGCRPFCDEVALRIIVASLRIRTFHDFAVSQITLDRMRRTGFISVLFIVLTVTCVVVSQDLVTPTPVSNRDASARRKTIQRELDANHDAVKDLYALLDVTPEEDKESRSFLDGQIQQFDERSNVLFEELDAIDKHVYQQQREKDLHVQVTRLESEAKQLRSTNHPLPAAAREAKAQSLRTALKDGSWKILIEGEWSCEPPDTNVASTVQLLVEVEKLKTEMAALREEVRRLQQLLNSLTNMPTMPQLISPE